MQYTYPNDGKYHTRYSEVTNCQTMNSALEVAKKRLGLKPVYDNDITRFGSLRHDMWEEEAKQTKVSPACFKEALGLQWGAYETENHRATELFENVVIHFTTDLIGISEHTAIHEDGRVLAASIIDYKTATEHRVDHYTKYYRSQLQLPSYALLLRPHGIIARDGHYLLECWDKERKNLKGYIHIEKTIALADMAKAKQMFKKGIQNLMAAEAHLKKVHNL